MSKDKDKPRNPDDYGIFGNKKKVKPDFFDRKDEDYNIFGFRRSDRPYPTPSEALKKEKKYKR